MVSNNQEQNAQADNPEVLLEMLVEAAKKLWYNICRVSSYIMVELGGYQVFEKAAQWSLQHPYISFAILSGGFVTLLPILFLVGIGLSTIVMTFTGFLFLEGTLLTILSMLLLACLGTLATVIVCLSVILVAAYFGFSRIYDLYGDKSKKTTENLKVSIS